MTKKRCLFAVGLIAVIGVAIGVLAFLPPRSGITKANFDRIENGMTRDEVCAILGLPQDPVELKELRRNESGWIRWHEDHTRDRLFVQFSEDGRVEDKDMYTWPDDRNFVQKLWDRRPWRQIPPQPIADEHMVVLPDQ